MPVTAKTAALLIVAFGLSLAGCGDNDGSGPDPSRTHTKVRPVQARPACGMQAVATRALAAIEARDYQALAKLVHPQLGLRFSPYATVNPDTDRRFSAAQLAAAASDNTVYHWGEFDGSGAPIELSIDAYFDRFVADRTFSEAPQRAVDKRLGHGNSIDNIAEAYADCRVMEFYVPGENPDYGGMDWASLRLVFVDYSECAQLVGIVHDQWTI